MGNEEEQKIVLDITETTEQGSETSSIDTNESDIDDSYKTTNLNVSSEMENEEEQKIVLDITGTTEQGSETSSIDTNESDVDDSYMTIILKGNSEKENDEQEQSEDDFIDAENSIESFDEIIDDFNNRAVLRDLTEQLVENELQKRGFKVKLMNYIKGMIIVQMFLIAIPVLLLTGASFLNVSKLRSLDSEALSIFCDFMKYYISAVIVEFIAMLFFIVKYVFDKSITELVKEYKISD